LLYNTTLTNQDIKSYRKNTFAILIKQQQQHTKIHQKEQHHTLKKDKLRNVERILNSKVMNQPKNSSRSVFLISSKHLSIFYKYFWNYFQYICYVTNKRRAILEVDWGWLILHGYGWDWHFYQTHKKM